MPTALQVEPRALVATHFLLYLNEKTFTEQGSDHLAEEVRRARAAGLPIAMAHETDASNEVRCGCEFSHFFQTVRVERASTAHSSDPDPCAPLICPLF